MATIQKNAQENVELLISTNANSNLVDRDGWSALMYAAEENPKKNLALLILRAGAESNLAATRDVGDDPIIKAGSTALDAAVNMRRMLSCRFSAGA